MQFFCSKAIVPWVASPDGKLPYQYDGQCWHGDRRKRGRVLTGMITAFLGQGMKPCDAAEIWGLISMVKQVTGQPSKIQNRHDCLRYYWGYSVCTSYKSKIFIVKYCSCKTLQLSNERCQANAYHDEPVISGLKARSCFVSFFSHRFSDPQYFSTRASPTVPGKHGPILP